jgi:heavy metal sensor kinase
VTVRTRLTVWYTAVLFAILVVMSAASYSLLRWTLIKDLDSSLLTVGDVVGDMGYAQDDGLTASAEQTVRQVLGPEVYDKFFRLIDPQGNPLGGSYPRGDTLPLSAFARANAARGHRTFETVRLAGGERARLLTLPVIQDAQLVELVQVGISLQHAHQTLQRYLETLLVLVPLGLLLAAAGGAFTARAALAPLDAISLTARRITAEDLSRRLATRGTGDELDRLADTLNDMLVRLEAAFAEIRRFTADAAHELRTPLTALKGGLEVALRSRRTADEYGEVLRSSLEDVERLIRLAEDLLLLTRASAGGSLKPARVELEPLVLDVLDIGLRLGHASSVTVGLAGTAGAAVSGDAMALRRALLNLVENAVKYTAAGGRVELSLRTVGSEALVAVRDTGVGILPADVARIFDPFVRLDAARARDTGGAGLGLAIAQSVITAHGGRLEAESVPGEGSVFTIRLPLA